MCKSGTQGLLPRWQVAHGRMLRLPTQGDVDTARMSPWLLRIEMARDMMVDKKLLLSEVAERINRCAWQMWAYVGDVSAKHSCGVPFWMD
jgi:hypothetical protein